ncbi:MAG: hypothetical protein ACPLRM_03405 [Anaerolineae bacterium]
MSTLFHEIVPFASTRTPQLVSGLVLCGAISFAVSDFRLGAWAFLGQRLILIVLLWAIVGASLALTSTIAAIAIALIFSITAWRIWYIQRSARKATTGAIVHKLSLNRFALRILIAALGILVSYGLVQKYHDLLPFLTAFTIAWLFVSSLLNLLLPDHALHKSLGILNFADGCRILYALWQPTPMIWGLWAACDVLIALAASHLRHGEVIVARSKSTGGQP